MSPNGEWTLAFQGAEARVKFGTYQGRPAVLKERFVKTYRHPELDQQLTKRRQKAEVRTLRKLKEKCPELSDVIPEVLREQDREIIMSRFENSESSCKFIGRALADKTDIDWLFTKIGQVVAYIHKLDIVHGDLTTSNILIDDQQRLCPIDFGLSSHSTSAEDRGVDLYVLERALQSTHVSPEKFELVLESYKKGLEKSEPVIKKLDEIRLRGRKRLMVG